MPGRQLPCVSSSSLKGPKMARTPYVVSSDVEGHWARVGLPLPKDALEQYRRGIFACLKRIFSACDWIPEAELQDGIRQLLTDCGLPIVSIDRTYTHNQDFFIEASRLHDENGKSLGVCGSWNDQIGTLELQVQRIARSIGTGQEVALVDDVIFSGKLFTELIGHFRAAGVKVQRLYAAVAIGEGIARLRDLGYNLDRELKAVRPYGVVPDQVCERDFMPGAPCSGRTVVGLPNTGMPYLLPYGKPTDWASIPAEHAAEFSATCLRLTATAKGTPRSPSPFLFLSFIFFYIHRR